MADVSTYKRCIAAYWWNGTVVQLGEVRLASDAAVVANPIYWAAITDADMSGGGKIKFH